MDYEYGANDLPLSGSKMGGDTDFARRFPSDPLGHEMGAEARVWRVYREEAKASDNALLDILLIFAGLFSAVATAFVIESYQLLQPDNAAYTAAALWILVAANNHSTGVVLPPPPDLTYASPLTRWINGLWFTSILLSLAVALLAILVKQWIKEYLSRQQLLNYHEIGLSGGRCIFKRSLRGLWQNSYRCSHCSFICLCFSSSLALLHFFGPSTER